MPIRDELSEVADLLERSANALAMFLHHAKYKTPMLDESWLAASELAKELFSAPHAVLNVGGTDITRLRSTAGTSILQAVLHARRGAIPMEIESAATRELIQDLLAAVVELRIEAARLE